MRCCLRCFLAWPQWSSLYGLAFDTAQIEKQVAALSGVLPAQTQELLSQELHSLAEGS